MARAPGVEPRGARRLALEGFFQSLAQGLADTYLSAFALSLGASGLALGFVSNLPTASNALAQALALGTLAGATSFRTFIARAWAGQAVCYACIGACAFAPEAWRVQALALLVIAAWTCGGVSIPAWTALVSTTLGGARLGWFFALRGAAQQTGSVAAMIGGGLLLSRLSFWSSDRLGFVLLFSIAGLSRLSSSALLVRASGAAHAPVVVPASAGGEVVTSRKFRRLCSYLWLVHLATHVSAPFFVPYMLVELGFSYALIGLLLAVPAVVKVATLRLWGRLADRVGPGPLLRGAGWLVAPIPALWLVSGSAWWILTAQLMAGLVWGAFELAQASSLLQTTRGQPRAVALFNLVDGGMILGGALVGGLVVTVFGNLGMSGYLAAMATSAVLRTVPAAFLLWSVRGIGRPPWSHRRAPLGLAPFRRRSL